MEDEKSKSQKKREAEHLQKIGIELTDLPPEKLESLPLSPRLREALKEARTVKGHGAVRRNAQLIGKLMRKENPELLPAYEALQAEASATTTAFHAIETWRTRLMTEGRPALTAFLDICPAASSQTLRQLVKKAITEQERNQSLGAAKALFRYLRTCLS